MEATLAAGAPARAAESRRFHLLMAGVFLLIAFGGFIPTYWAPVAHGTFRMPPIVHIHGTLLFSWVVFYFVQAWLVASGRTPSHRSWGLLGISLFSVLICSIIATRITLLRFDEAHGWADASRRFSAVAFLSLPLMIGLFAAAIANVKRPEIHKRWMYVLMAGMMTPAVARVLIWLLAPPDALNSEGPPPPVFFSVPPSIIGPLLVAVAMIHDWRTRGRPHAIYVWGLVILTVNPLLILVLSKTDWWLNTAAALERVGG